MKTPAFLCLSIALLAMSNGGCTHADQGDPSPLPAQDTQARVENATKSVKSSNMTSEQKQAAADYLKHGAANAAQIKRSAMVGGAPK